MPRAADDSELPEPIAPLSQKQEDLLIELFVQLSVADRKKVIKLCRDLLKGTGKKEK